MAPKGTAAYCDECGKWLYISKQLAKRQAKAAHPSEHLTAYACPVTPSLYHYGHLAVDVISGAMDRRDVYRKEAG